MGLWNFMTTKGKKLFGTEDNADAAGQALKDELLDLGLDASGIEISVVRETVQLTGSVPSQDDKEKIILAVGNVKGVAVVEDALPGTDVPVFHTVEKGETLWAISARHLGNGAKYNDIFEANKPMLKNPDAIYPGQVLRIPQ